MARGRAVSAGDSSDDDEALLRRLKAKMKAAKVTFRLTLKLLRWETLDLKGLQESTAFRRATADPAADAFPARGVRKTASALARPIIGVERVLSSARAVARASDSDEDAWMEARIKVR